MQGSKTSSMTLISGTKVGRYEIRSQVGAGGRARCADRLLDAFTSFRAALIWPEAQQRIQALLDRGVGALLTRGLQRDEEFEKRWPAVLGTLFET